MKYFIALLTVIFITACGYEQKPAESPGPGPAPTPTPIPGPGTGAVDFQAMTALMSTYCTECHAGAVFTKSEAGLKSSSARSRVQNSTMPPPYAKQMAAGDKTKFLSFFQ